MGLKTTYIRKPSRHAGKNRYSPEKRGQHTASNRYRHGSNWIECQRCGHDVPAEDARTDDYTKGLIVCPKCYDPMHPQEFVRAYEDKIAPSSGFGLGGGDSFSRTGKEGSTQNPYQVSKQNTVGTPADISDQTDAVGDTIATLTTSGCFFTSYYDDLRKEEVTISSYSVTGLPSGLSMDTTTGDITGTLAAGSEVSSPYSVVVTATWESGIVDVCAAFSWTVTIVGIAPDAIANLELWWDLSERDGSYAWQDTSRTISAAQGAVIGGLTDRSGNGLHAATFGTPADNAWNATGRNSHGCVKNTSRTVADPLVNMTAWSASPLEQPFTLIGVGEMHDSTGDVNRELWFSSNMSETNNLMTRFISNGQVMEVYKQSGGPVDITETPVLAQNTWWMIMIEVNGASSRIWLNNQEITLGDAIEPTGTIEGWSFVGGSQATAPSSAGVFDTLQGETCVYSTAILSTADREGLWLYMEDKWALTAVLP